MVKLFWGSNIRNWKMKAKARTLCLEHLENRVVTSFSQFVDPNPALGNKFGSTVLPLSTGNVVITAPGDDSGGTDAGAVYLFNGATGQLISTLKGSTANDQIGSGGVFPVGNGNYVVYSPNWTNGGAGGCHNCVLTGRCRAQRAKPQRAEYVH